jgi:mono/diheme cytochrome c family protein
MPRDRPQPPPFEAAWLERSLDRYLASGLVAMVLLLAGFTSYKIREPGLRADAIAARQQDYQAIGGTLFQTTCSSCHGQSATGGSAPTLNSKEFLGTVTDDQMSNLVAVGVPGTDMSAWSLDFGGTLTGEQIRQITTYLRSLEPEAPSVPGWRKGAKASP